MGLIDTLMELAKKDEAVLFMAVGLFLFYLALITVNIRSLFTAQKEEKQETALSESEAYFRKNGHCKLHKWDHRQVEDRYGFFTWKFVCKQCGKTPSDLVNESENGFY